MNEDLVKWLRREIEATLAAARDLIESEAASAVWHEPSSGVLVTGPPEHDDAWSGTFAIGDSRLTRFMASHDPRSVIADCEAKLAVLDEHSSDGDGIYPECVRCADSHPGDCTDCDLSLSGKHYRAAMDWPCRTVRLLASACRHRPGYRTEWSA